jgi:hypothetical protein
VSFPASLFADNPSITIDWAARVSGAQACPASVDKLTSVSLTVTGINNILYDYPFSEACEYLPSDAGNLPAASTPPIISALPVPPACSDAISAALDLRKESRLFPARGQSIALADTLAAWNSMQTQIIAVRTCTGSGSDVLYDTRRRLEDYAGRVPGSHDKKFVFTIDKSQLCSLELSEIDHYSHDPTGASLKWKCGVDDTLTLSLGTLLTTIDYRDYVHGSVPSGGSSTDSLVVNGRGPWTPIGVALLNYKLFYTDKGPNFGLTISSGPAFKLGGQAQVGTFGWFAGVSVSLWRRFFVTPGFHTGQFADFPAGFVPGQQIPSNFGTLTPVTRWTTRFAIGLTYRTNTLIKSTSTKTTGTSQTSTNTPKQ